MNHETPSQSAFNLALSPALSRDDFLVDASNENALGLIDRWPDWPHHALLIWGPAGAGKTHLLEIWRRKAAPSAPPPASLRQALRALREGRPAALDDAESMALQDEETFLHSLDMALSAKTPLLMTARRAPGRWMTSLPDLASRIRALPAIAIQWPSERLLRAIFIKIFLDRQRAVPENVVSYLLRRIGRAPDQIRKAALMLDRLAEEEMRPVSLSLARQVAAHLASD